MKSKLIKLLTLTSVTLITSCSTTNYPIKTKIVGINTKAVVESKIKNQTSFQIKDDLKNNLTVVSYTITYNTTTESFNTYIKQANESDSYQVDVYFIKALVTNQDYTEFYDYYCYGIVQYDQSNLQSIKYDVSFIEADNLNAN